MEDNKIIIMVEGEMVQEAYSNLANLNIEVLDYDDKIGIDEVEAESFHDRIKELRQEIEQMKQCY